MKLQNALLSKADDKLDLRLPKKVKAEARKLAEKMEWPLSKVVINALVEFIQRNGK